MAYSLKDKDDDDDDDDDTSINVSAGLSKLVAVTNSSDILYLVRGFPALFQSENFKEIFTKCSS
jgi:hypothetical protein